MATSGSVTSGTAGSGGKSYFQVNWSRSSVSIPNNKSTISWTLKLIAGNYWYTNAVRIDYVKINGTTVKGSETYSNKIDNTYTLASGTLDIPHNSDGTKTFTIELSGWFYDYGTRTGSANFTLDTIPRASSMSIPTLYAGSAATLSISRASSSFTHTIQYKFGSIGWTTIVNKTTATSVSWTPPLSLLQQMTNATSKTESSGLFIATYSGDTRIGYKYYDLTLNAASSAKPSVASFTVSPDNSGANSVVQGWGLYIEGITKISYALSGTGYQGSTINGYEFQGNGETIKTASGKTKAIGTIPGDPSSLELKGFVKDTRGRWSDASTKTISAYKYAQPKVNSVSAVRKQGETTTAQLTCTASLGASINGNNQLAISYELKDNSTGQTVDSGTLTNGVTKEILNLSLSNSYTVAITARDSVGSTIVRRIIIPTDKVTFHMMEGGEGVAFSKYAEREKCIDGGSWNYIGRVYGLGEALGAIPENGNLNDYTDPGVYAIYSNVLAETLLNFIPFPIAGTLIVKTGTGRSNIGGPWSYILQEFHAFEGSSTWIRYAGTGNGNEFVWESWKLKYQQPTRGSLTCAQSNGTLYWYMFNGMVTLIKSNDIRDVPAGQYVDLCTLPSGMAPPVNLYIRGGNNLNLTFIVTTDGVVRVYNYGSSSITTLTNGAFTVSYLKGNLFS